MTRRVAIADVAEVNPRLSMDSRPKRDEIVSFVPMAAVSEASVSIEKPVDRPYSEVAKGFTAFRRGDIIVAKITPCFENGKIAFANNLPRNFGFGSTEFHVLRPKNELDGSYLFHLLRCPFIRKAGEMKMKGAAGQRRVPAEFFKNLQIPLPPLADQKRIAGILDAADVLRARRRESLAQLDTLLQSTFLDMFGDPVTNPKGWEECELGQITADNFRNGLSPSTKGTIEGEVLTLSAITGGCFNFRAKKVARFDKEPAPTQKLSTNTFLICRGNGNKQLVGTGAFPDRSSGKICFPDTMIGVTIDSKFMTPAYLQNIWRSQRVRIQIERGARTTNGTHKVNQKLLSSISFPLPPLDLQRRFAAIVESVERQKARQRAHLAELDTLFAALQQRAFRGEL